MYLKFYFGFKLSLEIILSDTRRDFILNRIRFYKNARKYAIHSTFFFSSFQVCECVCFLFSYFLILLNYKTELNYKNDITQDCVFAFYIERKIVYLLFV